MIGMKYLLIISVVCCIMILYYFYDEISNIKKTIVPIYQKMMSLERKIVDLEKRNGHDTIKQVDSPAFEVTYRSDMANDGSNLSAKHANLSESDTYNLLRTLGGCPKNVGHIKNSPDLFAFDFRIADMIKRTTTQRPVKPTEKNQDKIDILPIFSDKHPRIPSPEREPVTPSPDRKAITSSEDEECDIRAISESIRMMDLPSENTISDI